MIPHKWDICQLWVLGHYYPFQGLFKNKRGILGYLSYRTFDFRQQLPSGEYSFAQYRSLLKHAHMQDMCLILPTCRILRSHWLKINATCISHARCVSHRQMCWCWKRTWGVKRGINKSCITIKLISVCNWSRQSQILLGFPRYSRWMKCLQVLSWSSNV